MLYSSTLKSGYKLVIDLSENGKPFIQLLNKSDEFVGQLFVSVDPESIATTVSRMSNNELTLSSDEMNKVLKGLSDVQSAKTEGAPLSIVAKLLAKLESADNLVVRIPYSDIKNLKDCKDATLVAKYININPGLTDLVITNIESEFDSDKKVFKIMIDTSNTIKNRDQVCKIIEGIFK